MCACVCVLLLKLIIGCLSPAMDVYIYIYTHILWREREREGERGTLLLCYYTTTMLLLRGYIKGSFRYQNVRISELGQPQKPKLHYFQTTWKFVWLNMFMLDVIRI